MSHGAAMTPYLRALKIHATSSPIIQTGWRSEKEKDTLLTELNLKCPYIGCVGVWRLKGYRDPS